jgi:hypothetical protein
VHGVLADGASGSAQLAEYHKRISSVIRIIGSSQRFPRLREPLVASFALLGAMVNQSALHGYC